MCMLKYNDNLRQICGLFGALYILEPHPMSSLAVFLDPLINYLTTKLSEVQL